MQPFREIAQILGIIRGVDFVLWHQQFVLRASDSGAKHDIFLVQGLTSKITLATLTKLKKVCLVVVATPSF